MKFFESKYALAITLGLLSTQMYLSKSSNTELDSYQLRKLAQSKPGDEVNCIAVSDLDKIESFKESHNCFVNFNRETKQVSVVFLEVDQGQAVYKKAQKTLTNTDLKSILGISSNPTQEQINAISNNQMKSVFASSISDFRVAGDFTVTAVEGETVIETEEEAVVADEEEVRVTPTEEESEEKALSRADLRKILTKYNDLSKSIKTAKNKCSFDEEEADFGEISETYEALSENFEDEKVTCDDRDCTNLTEDDVALAKELEMLIEDFPSKDSYTLTDAGEINSCKDAKLNDEDFLKEYRASSCSEGNGSIQLGSQRSSGVTRFRRENTTGPQPAVNESIARAQICYYQKEILPSLREGYATGDETLFNQTLDRANEIAGSIDSSSSNTNEAIRTSLQLEPEIGRRLRIYEDALHDQIYKINQSSLSSEQKALQINNLKKSAAAGFAADKAKISELLRNSNAMPAEIDLLLGDQGLYSFWGTELADINNERQPQLGAGSKNHIAALAFSGLDEVTQDAINNTHSNTEANVLDSNERALANAGVDPVRDQLDIINQPVPRTLRATRSARREQLLDLHPRLHRAEDAPVGGDRPVVGLNGLGGDQAPRDMNDPAVSYMVPDNVRRSQGRLSRDNQPAAQTIR